MNVSAFNRTGIMSDGSGVDRLVARRAIIDKLAATTVPFSSSIAVCSRTGDLVEPISMTQWYVVLPVGYCSLVLEHGHDRHFEIDGGRRRANHAQPIDAHVFMAQLDGKSAAVVSQSSTRLGTSDTSVRVRRAVVRRSDGRRGTPVGQGAQSIGRRWPSATRR